LETCALFVLEALLIAVFMGAVVGSAGGVKWASRSAAEVAGDSLAAPPATAVEVAESAKLAAIAGVAADPVDTPGAVELTPKVDEGASADSALRVVEFSTALAAMVRFMGPPPDVEGGTAAARSAGASTDVLLVVVSLTFAIFD
jgi:hypothetical protein